MKYEVTKMKNDKDAQIIIGVVITVMGLLKFGDDGGIFSMESWTHWKVWIHALFITAVGVYIGWKGFEERRLIYGDYLKIDATGFEYQQRGETVRVNSSDIRNIEIKSQKVEWTSSNFDSGTFLLKDYKGGSIKKDIKASFELLRSAIR